MTPPPSIHMLGAHEVLDYLRSHPTFLQQHPEILEWLHLPQPQHGEAVLDFQHFAIAALKAQVTEARSQIGSVVHGANARNSLQTQSHNAVLALMKVCNLEQFLECICVDFASIFQVDVVRLALESDMAGVYESYYPEQYYSGLTFMQPGTSAELFAKNELVRLVADTALAHPWLTQIIFHECKALAASVALLRIPLPISDKSAILAFGVRETGRFQHGQAIEPFAFLANACVIRLDQLLYDQAGLL